MKRLFRIILAVLSVILIAGSFRAVSAAVEPGSFMEVYFNNPYAPKRDTTLQDMIIEAINTAKNHVYLATYNFTDKKVAEALISAVDRGLEVRVVIHGENAGKDVVGNMEAGGVEIFEANGQGLMHAKFIVLDDDATISGSANMTPSSFFYDNNFMIFLRSKEANAIFSAEFDEMFFDNLFGAESPKSDEPGIIELEDGTRFLVRFAPEDNIGKTVTTVIEAARKEVRILAYSFTEDAIGKALVGRWENGVDVAVVFEGEKAFRDKGGEAPFLKGQGVPIFMDGSADALMHEKVVIIDGSFVAAGSYNFTRSADRFNDEQVLFISSPEIAEDFLAEFEKIYAEAEPGNE